MKKAYRVRVTREYDVWLAKVAGLEGTHTYARSLERLDPRVREAIALTLDLPEGGEAGLELEYDYQTGDSNLDKEARELRDARVAIREYEERLQTKTAAAVKALRTKGLSVRDVAALLSISSPWVCQLDRKD